MSTDQDEQTISGPDYLARYRAGLREQEREADRRGRPYYAGDGFFSFSEGRRELALILEAGQFEGITFEVLDRPIVDGDTYFACRNTSPRLLTARKVDQDNLWVLPVENAYAFDLGECIPIRLDI